MGYPEKVDPTPNWPTSPEYYNSVIIVNEDGETVANYRKCHLYYTDETWALEGQDGFFEGYIPGLGYAALGICKFSPNVHIDFRINVMLTRQTAGMDIK